MGISTDHAVSVWILRITLGLTCLGSAGLLLGAEEIPGVPMAIALIGLWAAVRPHWLPMVLVGGWLLLEAWGAGLAATGTSWAPYLFLGQAGRYVVPFALALVLISPETRWEPLAEWLLRIGAAATFFGHGFRAIFGYPGFMELLDLGLGIRGSVALTLLIVIGVVDVFVAGAVLVRRSRFVVGYMAVWGLLTAVSRVAAFGLEAGWAMALVRTGNFGVPLSLLAAWQSAGQASEPQPAPYAATASHDEDGP